MRQLRPHQIALDVIVGLILGAVAGMMICALATQPLRESGTIFDPLLAWPFSIVGGAFGGLGGSLTGRLVESNRGWVAGLALASLGGAIASLLVPLFHPWAEHVASFAAQLTLPEIAFVGGVYGLVSGGLVAWLNQPRKRPPASVTSERKPPEW
jgi:ammonia channel protein AmtB